MRYTGYARSPTLGTHREGARELTACKALSYYAGTKETSFRPEGGLLVSRNS